MSRKSRIEKLYERHNRDLYQLNLNFIQSLNRPRIQTLNEPISKPHASRKLSKKQLNALARGRKILALNRRKSAQI
jgi:hypothetical protein